MALSILTRALDEAAADTGAFAPDPEVVENAWLSSIVDVAHLGRPDTMAMLERIVQRRGKAASNDQKPLGAVLDALPQASLLEMLDYPAPPLVDLPWSDNWRRRDIILDSLNAYLLSRNDEVSREVITHPLFDDADGLGSDRV